MGRKLRSSLTTNTQENDVRMTIEYTLGTIADSEDVSAGKHRVVIKRPDSSRSFVRYYPEQISIPGAINETIERYLRNPI
jgi:hypothetical protein